MLTLLIDYDGTIVDHGFPEAGRAKYQAFETLIALKTAGHYLCLWTCREDSKERAYLTEAVEYCRANGVEFDAVNESPPHMEFRPEGKRRKPHADVHIDDRNFGGFPGWDVIRKHFLEDA